MWPTIYQKRPLFITFFPTQNALDISDILVESGTSMCEHLLSWLSCDHEGVFGVIIETNALCLPQTPEPGLGHRGLLPT